KVLQPLNVALPQRTAFRRHCIAPVNLAVAKLTECHAQIPCRTCVATPHFISRLALATGPFL
ncbi:MAG: hypothetical protein K8T91_06525, partial [Planctomycetes bacterium]|nr:hypothetical protein [Planctomycetota bacterium]